MWFRTGIERLSSRPRDKAGNLYGTARYGGDYGRGVVFKLDTTGNYRVLYSFPKAADGQIPAAALTLDPTGALYGTTYEGGDNGYGVVFKLIP